MTSNLPWGAERALQFLERQEDEAEYRQQVALTLAENLPVSEFIDSLPIPLADAAWAVLDRLAVDWIDRQTEAARHERQQEKGYVYVYD